MSSTRWTPSSPAPGPAPYQLLDRAMYRTAAMTGMRVGELIALRWRDVDWTASAVRVRSNYVLGELGTPKSKRSSRSAPWRMRSARSWTATTRRSGSPPTTPSCSRIRTLASPLR